MRRKGDQALQLALAGFNVFPLLPNSKRPAVEDWPNQATTDPVAINAWWGVTPDYNIGIHTDNLLVVDLDPKDDGARTWAGIVGERELFDDAPPPTMRVQTRSGGTHLYYTVPDGVKIRNSARKLGPGIDVRGHHGYVVGPGSVVDEKSYTVLEWDGKKPKPAAAPQWLIDRAQALRDRIKYAGKRLNEETPEALAEAERWIRDDAPEAVEGEQGDLTTFQVAAHLFDLGLDRDSALELMGDWNDEKAIPPWDLDELEAKVDSAMRNRQKPIGVDNPGVPPAGFEGVNLGETADLAKAPPDVQMEVNKPRFQRLRFGEAVKLADTAGHKPLVKGLLYAGNMSVIYGEPGAGKSFVMLDLAYHVAVGRQWQEKRVTQGPAVWLAAEGGNGVYKRIKALGIHYETPGDPPLFLYQQPIDLLHKDGDLAPLVKELQQLQEEEGPIKLLIVDTLAQVMAGGDENGPEDMGAFLKNMRLLRHHLGPELHLNLVHHTGKDAARGARGHSSLKGAVDTEMEVTKKGRFSASKQRDIETKFYFDFSLKDVTTGKDEDGDAVTSAVVVSRVSEGTQEIVATMSTDEQRLLTVIDAALAGTSAAFTIKDFVLPEAAKKRLELKPEEVAVSDAELLGDAHKNAWQARIRRTFAELVTSKAISKQEDGKFYREIKKIDGN